MDLFGSSHEIKQAREQMRGMVASPLGVPRTIDHGPDEVELKGVGRLEELRTSLTAAGNVHGGILAVTRGSSEAVHPFGVSPPTHDGDPGGTLAPLVEVCRDSRFLVASLTTPVTATAVMQLVERGLILLDVPVASYLPEFSGRAGHMQVTVRHLLTHTSGLPDGAPAPHAQLRRRAHGW